MGARVDTEIAIVGAGVIGLAIALQLLDDGREVMLIDPNEPGSGASSGNAATIADYGCVPVGGPQVIRSLPRLLLDGDSPLSLPLSVLPSMLPWFLRFVRACTTSAAAAGAASLAPLLAQAGAAWERRWGVLRCDALVRREGCLYLYRDAPSPHDLGLRLRTKHGVRQEVLSPRDVARLEPALAPLERHGLFFPDSMHIDSPTALMQHMAAAVQRQGAPHRRAHVVHLRSDGSDVVLELQANGVAQLVRARQVVIAAGAHSLELARQAGESVPLDTERGYHLEYDVDTPPIRRPVCPVERGIYATPLTRRLPGEPKAMVADRSRCARAVPLVVSPHRAMDGFSPLHARFGAGHRPRPWHAGGGTGIRPWSPGPHACRDYRGAGGERPCRQGRSKRAGPIFAMPLVPMSATQQPNRGVV